MRHGGCVLCRPTIDASRKDHIQEHVPWIKSSLKAKNHLLAIDGSSLWEHREDFFPHLQFCLDVKSQLQIVLHGNEILYSILSKLFLLEQFCEDWSEGPFESSRIGCKASTESDATLEKYRQERIFNCPDGEVRLFSWHIRLTPGAWRIHSFPLENEKRLIIGYIGRHLSVVTSR